MNNTTLSVGGNVETKPEFDARMLLERITALEEKVDIIVNKLDQAAGAWMFVKILCSVTFGLAVIYNSIQQYLIK